MSARRGAIYCAQIVAPSRGYAGCATKEEKMDIQSVLLTPEELKVRDEVREFAKTIPADLIKKMDQGQIEFPYEFDREAGKRNLLGLRFPKKWGGRGMNWTCEIAAIEEVAVLGTALACQYSLPIIVGEAINMFGSDEQKEKFLKPTLQGKLYCAEALTEPRGGSDFFGATTIARKDGNNYILTGAKRFIVGGKGADYFLVYAKTAPEAEPHKSISVFLVERDRGVKVETIYGLMGTRGGGTARISFKDVKVPRENLVGPENAGGIIFNQMMLPERLTSAAGSVGGARAAIEIAARYSMKRKAFGRTIRKFQAVSFKVAESLAKIDAARGLVYTAARVIDAGLPARRIVSEAKKFATEMAWEVVNNAMQIMGGIGYTDVYPIERMLRDTRLTMIWTGTSEIMSALIQHEYYDELEDDLKKVRDVEKDAVNAEMEIEKVYE